MKERVREVRKSRCGLASDCREGVAASSRVGGERCLGASPRTRNSGIPTDRTVPAVVRRGSRECVNRVRERE